MPDESIQPEDFISTELQKFTLTEATIAEMRANYLTIKVADFNDRENAALARSRRLEVKDLRVATNKMREEMKADSIKFGKAVERKAQSIIKPLAEIEAYLQEQEDVVAKHKEREEAKERARIAAENEAERQRLEIERQKIEAERAEIERQKAEIENAKQREVDIAAAVELGRQRAIAERGDDGRPTIHRASAANLAFGSADVIFNPERRSDREMLTDFAKLIADMPTPPVAGRVAYDLTLEIGHRLRELVAFIEKECEKL